MAPPISCSIFGVAHRVHVGPFIEPEAKRLVLSYFLRSNLYGMREPGRRD